MYKAIRPIASGIGMLYYLPSTLQASPAELAAAGDVGHDDLLVSTW
jgi:hypothetical protein